MFISRKVYDDLRDSLVQSRAEVAAATQVNAQLNAHLEWARLRLIQLETERAQLLKRYMNLDVPVPELVQEQPMPDLGQTLDFNDMGDDMADKLGLGWNADGSINLDKYKRSNA